MSLEDFSHRRQGCQLRGRTDGALKSRTDHLPATDLKETFTHDNLRRLTRASSRHASGTRNLDYRYDTLGNLTSKTSNVNADADVTGYTYSSTKPNALTSVRVGTENLTLTHDTVGNVTAINSNSGEDKAFTYNAHNLATSIRVTNHQGSRVAEETFEYGPDNQRYLKKTVSVSNGRTTTSYTVYAHGGKIERIIASNGYTTKKIRVTGKVTVRTTPSRYPNWSRVYHYALHRDHLGSVYTTTDDNGTAGTAITHDPFGGGRRSDWSRGSTQSERVASLESLAYRYVRTGLTGHEALERTGITHMNGRLYDPVIGRFLNADPYVQSPGFSQSHNRYSYVMNSPTGFTDPSGYQCQRGQDGECGDPTPNPIRPLPRWRPSPGPSLAQIWQAYQNMLRREDTANRSIMGYQVAAATDSRSQAHGNGQHMQKNNDNQQRVRYIDDEGIEPSYLLEGILLLPWRATTAVIRGVGSLVGLGRSSALLVDDALRVGEFTYTKTAGRHAGDVVKSTGQAARPYMNSPHTIREIISTGRSIPDPRGATGALRFDVPGSFRGSHGTWELVVNPKTNMIYHFNFVTSRVKPIP